MIEECKIERNTNIIIDNSNSNEKKMGATCETQNTTIHNPGSI